MSHTLPLPPDDVADDPEALLIARAKQGEAAAFEAIVQRYQRQIYSFTYRMLGNGDDAYDLTQECFVKAYRALARTRDDLNLSAWLHRIAANACLDVLRRRQRLRWLPWEAPKHDQLLLGSPADDPERSALSQETRAVVQQVLTRMSHRHRAALILREYEGLSCAEIGAVMGLSRPAAKSMLFRARQEFKLVYGASEQAAVPAGVA